MYFKMKRDNHDSINEMIVYKIVGGDLAMVKDSSNARFEFRRILDTNEGIARCKDMNQHYHGEFISLLKPLHISL